MRVTRDPIVQINLIKPPHFVVTVQTTERAVGIATINAATKRICDEIEQRGGSFKITQEVRCVVAAFACRPTTAESR